MRKKNPKATIKDVAREAGVSTATVERALNNAGRIKPETRQRVLHAVKALNYQINDVARVLQNNQYYNILALYHKSPEYFTIEFERGFRAAESLLSSRGLILTTLRSRSLAPQDALEALKQADFSDVDAMLIDCGGAELDGAIREIMDRGIPVATFGSDSPSSGRTFYVGEDPFVSGQVAADIACKVCGGQGRFMVFQGQTSVHALKRRTEGFLSVLSEGHPGIELLPPVNHDDEDTVALRRALRVLGAPQLPDCIFCNSAPGAVALNRAMVLLDLPADKLPTVIGYDFNAEIYDMLQRDRCFCTIYQNPYIQAYNAVHYMFEYLRSGTVPTLRDQYAYSHMVFKYNAKMYLD